MKEKRKRRLLQLDYDDENWGLNLTRRWMSSSKCYGLLDGKQRMVLPCAYDIIRRFDADGCAWVRRNGLWGLVDTTGRFLVNLQFEEAGTFVNGLCWVKKNGHWGRIDRHGNVVTPYTRDAHHAVMAFLVVEHDGRYGAIDADGLSLLPTVYDSIEEQILWEHGYSCWSGKTDEGLRIALAKCDDEFWLLDDFGHKRFEEPFTSLYCQVRCDVFPFHTKEFCYRANRLFIERRKDASLPADTNNCLVGIYDVQLNQFIAPCIYDRIAFKEPSFFFDYSHPYCVAARDGKETLLDMNGHETMPLEYDSIDYNPSSEDEYLIPAFKDGLWGYINAEGVIKIPFRYRWAGQFANGVAEVQFGRRHNGIDIEDLTPGHDHPITIDRHGKIVNVFVKP